MIGRAAHFDSRIASGLRRTYGYLWQQDASCQMPHHECEKSWGDSLAEIRKASRGPGDRSEGMLRPVEGAVRSDRVAESVERMEGERERVMGLLRERADELRAQGVRGLALFGSVARGEARPDSDVDLLVELDGDTTLGFGVVGLRDELQRLLGREVGLTFAGGQLRPGFRERTARDLVQVF